MTAKAGGKKKQAMLGARIVCSWHGPVVMEAMGKGKFPVRVGCRSNPNTVSRVSE
jgi:hypothetical protein